jgi:hypothetical protein
MPAPSRSRRSFEAYADERLFIEDPEANQLAYERLRSPGTIFYDTHSHRLLEPYENREALVVHCLHLANIYSVKRYGRELALSGEEKKLLKHYSVPFAQAE